MAPAPKGDLDETGKKGQWPCTAFPSPSPSPLLVYLRVASVLREGTFYSVLLLPGQALPRGLRPYGGLCPKPRSEPVLTQARSWAKPVLIVW